MNYKRDQWCERCHRWHLFIEMCNICLGRCIGCCATAGPDRYAKHPHDKPGIWDHAKDFNYERLKYPVGEFPGDKCILCGVGTPLPGSDRCKECLDTFGPD